MTTTADAKKRVVIGGANPGDVFDVQKQADGLFLLVRMIKPELNNRTNRSTCLSAIKESPLHPKMHWNELRQLTREL